MINFAYFGETYTDNRFFHKAELYRTPNNLL